MRILNVCSWFQPQLGYSEFHLPTAMQKLGHTVKIVTSDRYYPFPNYDATVRNVLGERIVGPKDGIEFGLRTIRLPVGFEFRHHLWLKSFERVIANFQPDVVHVYQTFTLPTLQSALYKRSRDFALVVRSSMEKEVFQHQPFARRLFYRMFSTFAAPILRRNVDIFTGVGSGACEIVSDVVRIPRSNVSIAPLGADSDRFRFDMESRESLRQQLGISRSTVLIIYAGKLIENKDLHVLANAFCNTSTETDMALLLLGAGSEQYCRCLREILSLTARPWHIVPPVPNSELPKYFSAADIAVWPSESSNSAIEAALIGLPIVVSDSIGSRRYVEAENGMKFARGDVRELASCLKKLAEDGALRRELGTNGHNHVRRNLSWTAIAEDTIRSYSSVLVRRRNIGLRQTSEI